MNKGLGFLVIILLLACSTQIASDIYTPSLITIAHQLVGANLELAQSSVFIFLVGVSISQLIAGPVSERVGRKKPMLMGLIIMAVGSIMAMSATHMSQLILARLIQGLGAGALAALWRAVFRDSMSGEMLAKYSSFISIFMIVALSAAPALGGYFESISWRCSFLFMLLYGLMCLMVLKFAYQEERVSSPKASLKLSVVLQTYGRLLKSRLFMGITCCTFLTYGAVFAWVVVAPALLMHELNVSAVRFGWIMAFMGAVAYGLAAFCNGVYVKRLGMPSLMRLGWGLAACSACLLLLTHFFWGLSVVGLMVPIFIFYFATTLIWSNAFSTAFTPFGDIAGYAGSLYGFMQLIGGAIMGALVTHVSKPSQLTLAAIILIAAVLAFGLYQFVVFPVLKPSQQAK